MSEQFDLFNPPPKPEPQPKADAFDGVTYDPEADGKRLTSMMGRVYSLMSDGRWRTLREISEECAGSEAGVSARLRDLRKSKFATKYPNRGVERERIEGGLHRYRMIR